MQLFSDSKKHYEGLWEAFETSVWKVSEYGVFDGLYFPVYSHIDAIYGI